MPNTVLIIDDDGFDGMIITALLNQTNYKVIAHCKNGFEGVKMAKNLSPDFIFVDKLMPEMDGLQVIEELFALKLNTKIILRSTVSSLRRYIYLKINLNKEFIIQDH